MTTLDEFRRTGHQIVEWMAEYLDELDALPVRAPVRPGEITEALPNAAPETGTPLDGIFADFREQLLPGITHWQHPRFFAYFPANSSPPSVLAEMVMSVLAAQCMSWETSPAATELEMRVLEWLRDLWGLPADFVGSIQDTASTATLTALLVARERASGWQVAERGASEAGPMTVYCSAEAHSSVEKNVRLAGIGRRHLSKIPVDGAAAMRPDALDAAIVADRAAGRTPLCVVATLGTTGVSGFDPLPAIGEICERHGLWLHVDAAWAGSALVLPECRWMIDGIAAADSVVVNPHKWLLTNFDCSAFYVRDPDALVRTCGILPEYLKTRQGDGVVNYRDWGIQLGRRFRALKLWFVLRAYGAEGLRDHIRGHIEWSRELAERIADDPSFELLRAPRLALTLFRFAPPGIGEERLDALNERLVHALNDSGRIYLTHTRWQGRYAIRFVVGSVRTERAHVVDAWELIRATAGDLHEQTGGADHG